MEVALIMGIATAFNILVIFKKTELKRYTDAFFDGGILITLSMVFGGSLGGMMVATVASAVISIYFMFNPPSFTQLFDSDDTCTEEEETQSSSHKVNLIQPINMKGL